MGFDSLVTGAAAGDLTGSPMFGLVVLVIVVVIVAFWFNRKRKERD